MMTTFKILILFIALINVNFSRAKRECLSIQYSDFSECSKLSSIIEKYRKIIKEDPSKAIRGQLTKWGSNLSAKNSKTNQTISFGKSLTVRETCSYEEVCNKTFRVTQIEYSPFSWRMYSFIMRMLSVCCGKCAKHKIVFLENNSKLNTSILENTDIIFPIFSFHSTQKIYGFWYIPMVEVPIAYYFQKAPSQSNAMDTMLKDFGNLWPLLLICFVFAIGAGLFIWLLDTWRNKEEFPREFLIGWFEGFWWSFISMTTVGYGDKAPKSRLARLFSIGWILIGITIFSMLTASLSSIITNAEMPPSVHMTSKRVGALKDRVYDATVIAKHGGRVRIFSYDNITHGVNTMIDALFSKDNLIDGFLLDKFSYMIYCMENCERLDNTIRTEKSLTEKYSFGALVREENEYTYLSKYVEYNWFYFDTCYEVSFNEIGTQINADKKVVVFSIGSGLFKPIVIGFSVFIVSIFIIGSITSFLKKGYLKKKITADVEMNYCN